MKAASIFLLIVFVSVTTTASEWRCHIIDPDPKDHGPDGVTVRDFDGDGLPDLLVPFEEGNFSRLYFHPGFADVRHQSRWSFIEFPVGGEDNGAGDLDQDGFEDIIINGGQIFFNPGPSMARDPSAWQQMTLFKKQARAPLVHDVDRDGHQDLLVDAVTVYRAPHQKKRNARGWIQHSIGTSTWAMNAILDDFDLDGDTDILVADRRGSGTVWLEAPNESPLQTWRKHIIDPRTDISFMQQADLNLDGLKDLVLTTKDNQSVSLLIRKGTTGSPSFDSFTIPQVSGDFPKGINVADYDRDRQQEIFVLAKGKGEWMIDTDFTDQGLIPRSRNLNIPGSPTRLKMDNAINADLDGDGDIDLLTTDENGGWGVIWFENPTIPKPQLLPNAMVAGRRVSKLLHSEDFDSDLGHWSVEQMPGGTATVHRGILEIDDAKGCTIWFRNKLSAPVLIEFDIKMIQDGGPHDRTSDLNSFTMAIDPQNPDDLLAGGDARGGSFKNYHPLRLYYVGYGANKNRTARFRRYAGDGSRPVLPEHDLERSHIPNQWRRVQILSTQGNYKYLIDDEVIFNVDDSDPYLSGWFGFRTVRNHMAIDRFRVWQLEQHD